MKVIVNETVYDSLSQKFSNEFRRRIPLLDKLIDVLLPQMYPCDFDDENNFVRGVMSEISWLVRNEQYGLDMVDAGDISDYLFSIKKDDLIQYYKEHCEPSENDINEMIKLDIKVGDILMGGKFKNKKVVVKDIGKNEKGDITINGKPLLRFRIQK